MSGGLGFLFAIFGFSMTGIWVAWLDTMDPLALVGWRVAVALIALVPVLLIRQRERSMLRHWLAQPRVHLTAMRMTGFFIIAVIGFQQAPVAVVLLMLGMAPAWVLLYERFQGARFQPAHALGVALALVGAGIGLVPTLFRLGDGGSGPAIGALCGLGAGMLSASYALGRRKLTDAQGRAPSAFLLAGLTSAWGLLAFGMGALTRAGELVPHGLGAWGAVAGLGLVSTAGPLWGFAAAARALPPLLVSLATPMIPFGGALCAWLLLGQTPSTAFFLGAPLVLGGIGLVLANSR